MPLPRHRWARASERVPTYFHLHLVLEMLLSVEFFFFEFLNFFIFLLNNDEKQLIITYNFQSSKRRNKYNHKIIIRLERCERQHQYHVVIFGSNP